MGILWWIGVGLVIALLANWKMSPINQNEMIITIASGILGAIAGGIICAAASGERLVAANGTSLIFAAAGALLALLGGQLLKTTLSMEH